MSDRDFYSAAYDAAEAECKALRAENDMLREEIKQLNAENDRLISDLARATLERDRLRETLAYMDLDSRLSGLEDAQRIAARALSLAKEVGE